MLEFTQNRVLAALPQSDLAALERHLEPSEMRSAQVLVEPEAIARHVWFPTTAVCSMVNMMSNGATIETDLVGNEGVVGSWLALGATRAPWKAIIQLPGEAFELPVAVFLEQLEASPVLRKLVLRYALSEHYLSAQSVGCNRFHELSERAARWLLTLQDRTEQTELALTQEFLSQMLGVQRPTVTIAVGMLEQAGLLERLSRGHLRIRDRAALEGAACECYARVRTFNARAQD